MLTLAIHRLRADRASAIAIIVSVGLAVAVFGLSISAAEFQRLSLRETLDASYRASYDILVRPPGARMPLEQEKQMIRAGFSSDIRGGISFEQLNEIRLTPGVEVAAPLITIGHAPLQAFGHMDVTKLMAQQPRMVVRYKTQLVSRNGAVSAPGLTGYGYFTTGDLTSQSPRVEDFTEVIDGEPVQPCPIMDQLRSAYPTELVFPTCQAATAPFVDFAAEDGRFELLVVNQVWPTAVASIDPVAEAQLVGLDDAVTAGRYLSLDDSFDNSPVANRNGFARPTTIPVLLATSLGESDYKTDVTIDVYQPDAMAQWLEADPRHRAALFDDLDLPTTTHVATLSAADVYQQTILAQQLVVDVSTEFPDDSLLIDNYTVTGPVTYSLDGSKLRPEQLAPPTDDWQARFMPLTWQDSGYRAEDRITLKSAEICENPFGCPTHQLLAPVGLYDPALIDTNDGVTAVPLELYRTPTVAAADEATATALGHDEFRPDLNPRGYLPSPPGVLMSISSLPAFTESWPEMLTDAISSVRVCVDVDEAGFSTATAERLRLVAERIAVETGLTVDITTGSALTSQRVELPASTLGVPAISLDEYWSSKGVVTELVPAVDTKSVALTTLVLISAVAAVSACTLAMAKRRRRELGIFSAVGWRPAQLTTALLAALAMLGWVAGLLGALVATTLAGPLGLDIELGRALTIGGLALGLIIVASLPALVRVARSTPLAAFERNAPASHSRAPVTGPKSFGVAMLLRQPFRFIIAVMAVSLPVGTLGFLATLQRGFLGQVTGTLLGEAITLQARPLDLMTGALLGVLGLFATAMILWLGMLEDASDYATLEALGWRSSAVLRALMTQSAVIGGLGACTGVGLSWAAAKALRLPDFASAAHAVIGAVATIVCLALGAWPAFRHRRRSITAAFQEA